MQVNTDLYILNARVGKTYPAGCKDKPMLCDPVAGSIVDTCAVPGCKKCN